MHSIGHYLLADAYSGFSPIMSSAATCTLTGQSIPCSDGFFGVFLAIMGGIWLVSIALAVLAIIGLWKMFVKAGRPGWASIIPIYNLVVMLEIIGKPVWWVILAFIPFANVVIGIIVAYHLANVFGKGIGYTIGIMFLPFIFYPILGFGKSVYTAPNPNDRQTQAAL